MEHLFRTFQEVFYRSSALIVKMSTEHQTKTLL